MSRAALLRLEEVACVRGGRLLFEGLDLSLGPGEAALVTGPNGAGKSSLVRLAAGLLRPAGGRVTRSAPAALADENLGLEPKLTLRRALGFWAGLDGAVPGAAIETMGLGPLADVPVRMLSAGQRKRAALARVLASGAPLWFLDEPGNGLDAEGVERIEGAIAAHREAGGAILAVSHQPLALPEAKPVRLG